MFEAGIVRLRDARPTNQCLEPAVPLFSRGFVRRRAISLATSLSVMATSFALAQAPKHQPHVLTVSDVDKQSFLFDNDLAMSNMNRGMLTRPTGDVDRDFVDIMIPHHQGVIDTARAEMKYGHDETLRQLAQKIVEEAEQDISTMRGAKPAIAASAPPHIADVVSSAPN